MKHCTSPTRTTLPATRTVLAGLTVALLTLVGCMVNGPLHSKARTKPAKSAPHSSERLAPFDTAARPGVGVLRINHETLQAQALWWEINGELKTQAQALSPQGYRAFVNRRAVQLVSDRITEALLYQRASLGLPSRAQSRLDTGIDAEIRRIVTTEHGGVERRYVKHLDSQGKTLQDVREKMRREIIIGSYLEQEVKPKVPQPTRAELLQAFERIVQSSDRLQRRRMSLIDVRVPARLPAELQEPTRQQLEQARLEARSRIEAARAALDGGTSFADVAREFSDGLHASEGGSWDWVTPGSVRERFEPAVEALYALTAGQISEVIETTDALMLVRCDEIEPAATPDFQAVQTQLEAQYFRKSYNRLVMKLIDDLRKEAGIDPRDIERFHAGVAEAAPAQESFNHP